MKRFLIGAVLGLAMSPVIAEDGLDEILECNYETRGGYENIKAVDSAKFTGTMTMGPMEAPFTIYFKRPEMVRLEFEIQGVTAVQAYDGETGWSVMPFMGKTEPEEMPEDEVKNVKDMADLDGPLVDWEEKGHEVEYLGKEEAQGTEAHVIKVTRESGDEQTFYLDTDHCLTFLEKATRDIQGNEMKTATELGNYKPVGDIVMPFSIQTRMGEGQQAQTQSVAINDVDLNVDIPDEKFTMPEPSEKAEAEDESEDPGSEDGESAADS